MQVFDKNIQRARRGRKRTFNEENMQQSEVEKEIAARKNWSNQFHENIIDPLGAHLIEDTKVELPKIDDAQQLYSYYA